MCGVIVEDAGRSRSTCLGCDAYIHDHCHECVITMRFSINFPIVICSPTICYVFKREASSENMSMGLLLSYYKIQKYFAAIYLLLFYFAIYPSTYTIWLTTLLPALGANICFCVCRCQERSYRVDMVGHGPSWDFGLHYIPMHLDMSQREK